MWIVSFADMDNSSSDCCEGDASAENHQKLVGSAFHDCWCCGVEVRAGKDFFLDDLANPLSVRRLLLPPSTPTRPPNNNI